MSDEQSQATTHMRERPAPDGYTSWPGYWKSQGMPWRTEPEIDEERQNFLAARREIVPDIESGVYPFKDIKLDRADVEWLLATHESGGISGPIDWQDVSQRLRAGLDLRKAELQGVDLHRLPLAAARMGAVNLEGSDLREAKFERGDLSGARLERAVFWEAQLSEASLAVAHAGGVAFTRAHMERADLRGADFHGAIMVGARLQEADMTEANFRSANLKEARLEGAILRQTRFEHASLLGTHLEKADLRDAHLGSTDLRQCTLDANTDLRNSVLGDGPVESPVVVGVRWGTADLSEVSWLGAHVLGDELEARRPKDRKGKSKSKETRIGDFEAAARASRQVASTMRQQGMNEHADRFSYRSQLLQRVVYWRRGQLVRYLGSLLLGLISGYGYKPLRSLYTYLLTIGVFAPLFWCVTNNVSLTFGWFTNIITWLGMSPPPPTTQHLQGYEAVVVSMTSFHGRGFFQPVQSPGDKVAILAAIEAFFGLLLEIVLIATFTQRFFAR